MTDIPSKDSNYEIKFRGRFLHFAQKGHWEFATREHNSEVAVIIPVTEAKELVLVEQHRIPLGKATIELPAGLIGDVAEHANETVATGAARELEEETGFRPGSMRELIKTPTSAGLTDETAVFFLAENLQQVSAGGGDETEDIQVHVIALTEVCAWLMQQYRAGKAVDPKIYSALYWLEHPEALA
ncbi:MAG: NUDIX hydrolase [Xanthomonadales bacterium]|jgi:ADP-ribose pyrophosphatase|nr:NUDIX hydrolase [Xanthomonadales bacterium]